MNAPTITQHRAHLWVAPGIAVGGERWVPSPPPPDYYIDMVPPPPRDVVRGEAVPVRMQTARFYLRGYSPECEVVHYDLATAPPDGCRWIVVGDSLQLDVVTR